MYYKVTDKYVYKYDVILNIKQLHDIKNEIIDKCSFISHESFKTKTPIESKKINFRNYTKTKLNNEEYLIEYDYLEIPKLVDYIVELLCGNTSIIDKIINYEETMNSLLFEEKKILQESEKVLDLISKNSMDINTGIKILAKNNKMLLKYRKDRENNKKRKSSNNYVSEVINCITFKEVGCINKNEFYKELNDSKNVQKSKKLIK